MSQDAGEFLVRAEVLECRRLVVVRIDRVGYHCRGCQRLHRDGEPLFMLHTSTCGSLGELLNWTETHAYAVGLDGEVVHVPAAVAMSMLRAFDEKAS